MALELGSDPILVADGNDLLVKYAYKQEGIWYEIRLSNGYLLSKTEGDLPNLAKRVSALACHCIASVCASEKVEKPEDISFNHEESGTGVQVVGKDQPLSGANIQLLQSFDYLGDRIENVDRAMAVLNRELTPHRIQHGPIQFASEAQLDLERYQQMKLRREWIMPPLKNLLAEAQREKRFPFKDIVDCDLDRLVKDDFPVQESERARIQQELTAYIQNPDSDSEAKRFLQSLMNAAKDACVEEEIALAYFLQIFRQEKIPDLYKEIYAVLKK